MEGCISQLERQGEDRYVLFMSANNKYFVKVSIMRIYFFVSFNKLRGLKRF